MAKAVTHKGKTTRASGTRTRRWGRTLSRKRQEVTRMLPLSGMHPAQLKLADLSVDNSFDDFSIQDAPPMSVHQVRASYTRGAFVPPAVPLDLTMPAPVQVVAPAATSPCEARKERREVLFATNRAGGGHAPTPPATDWGVPCK